MRHGSNKKASRDWFLGSRGWPVLKLFVLSSLCCQHLSLAIRRPASPVGEEAVSKGEIEVKAIFYHFVNFCGQTPRVNIDVTTEACQEKCLT